MNFFLLKEIRKKTAPLLRDRVVYELTEHIWICDFTRACGC
jgi:hypothetical protein